MTITTNALLAAVACAALAQAHKPLKKHFAVQQYGCPDGLRVKGKQCVGTQEVPMSESCQSGFEMQNGQCVAFSRVLEFCDAGFTRVGSECIRKMPVQPVPECQDDYTLINGRCEKTVHVHPECPAGTTQQGKECTTDSELLYRCDGDYHMVAGKCLKKENVDLVPQCNVGSYNSRTNTCEEQLTRPQICPNGTTERNGQCVEEKNFRLTCANGFTLRHGECINIEKVEKVPTCNNGYSYNSQLNQCEMIEPLEPVCPHGTRMGDSKQCYRNAAVQKKCPHGFTLRTRNGEAICEDIERVDLQPECADDESLTHGHKQSKAQCSKLIPQEPVCPPGTTECPETHKCKTFSAPARRCADPSHKLLGDVCVTEENADMNVDCADGYQLVDDTCEKIIHNEPVCPHNYTDVHGRCTRQGPLRSRCPDGFTRAGTKCLRFLPQALVPKCTKGMELEAEYGQDYHKNSGRAMCTATLPGTLKDTCKDNETLVNDQCMATKVVQANRLCPEDYQLKGNKCEKTVEFDCSTTKYEEQCEDASSFRKTGNHGLHAHKQPPARTVCTKVPHLKSKMCQKTVAADVITECPYGTEVNGGSCLQRTYRPADKECLDGESVQNCNRIKKKPAQMVCPLGTPRDGSRCGTEEFEDVEEYCDNEFELVGRKCLLFAGKVCPGGECTTRLTNRPRYTCPQGFHKGNRAKFGLRMNHKDSEMCTRVLRNPSQLYCRDDQANLDGNKCVISVEKLYREPLTRTRPAPMVCPLGDTRRHGCNIVNHEEPINYCQNGYQLFNDTCVQFADKVCPTGNNAAAAGCSRLLINKPTYVCPLDNQPHTVCQSKTTELPNKVCSGLFNLNFNGSACERFENKVCPTGGCSFTRTHQPDMICPVNNGRSTGHKGCYTTDEKLPEPYCASGFEMLGNQCLKFFPKVCPGNQCSRVETVPATFRCPVETDGKMGCFDVVRADLNFRCSGNAVQCGKGQCCDYSATLAHCPAGATLQKGRCVRPIATKMQPVSKK